MYQKSINRIHQIELNQDELAASSCKNCPVGRFCPKASVDPVNCPKGTYSNALNLTSIHDCQWCPKGKYCLGRGLNKPTGNCQQGFYCPGKSFLPSSRLCPGINLFLLKLTYISSSWALLSDGDKSSCKMSPRNVQQKNGRKKHRETI